MRRLDLDFQPARRAAWFGWLLLLISLTAAGKLVLEFRDLQADLAHAQGRSARLEARLSGGAPADLRGARDYAAQLAQARGIAKQLTLPWGDLFEAVESAATTKVALVALQPDADQEVVRITAETKDLDDALAFVRRLQETRRLNGVYLASHQVQAQDPRHPVRFVVMAGFGGGEKT